MYLKRLKLQYLANWNFLKLIANRQGPKVDCIVGCGDLFSCFLGVGSGGTSFLVSIIPSLVI